MAFAFRRVLVFTCSVRKAASSAVILPLEYAMARERWWSIRIGIDVHRTVGHESSYCWGRWTTTLDVLMQVLQTLNSFWSTVIIMLRVRHWNVIVLNWMKLKSVQVGSLWQLISGDVNGCVTFKTFFSPSKIFHNIQEIVTFLIGGKLVRLKVSLEGIHRHTSWKIYSHPCIATQMIHTNQNRNQSRLVKTRMMKFWGIW